MLATWRKKEFIPNFLKMRQAMNAMLESPKSDLEVREEVARALVGQIPYCLRLGKFRIARGFADFAVENLQRGDRSFPLLLKIGAAKVAGLLEPR